MPQPLQCQLPLQLPSDRRTSAESRAIHIVWSVGAGRVSHHLKSCLVQGQQGCVTRCQVSLACRESADTAHAGEAVSALCSALPQLLQPERPAVLRQSALASFGAAASALGRGRPAPLLAALPSVLATAKVEESAA